MRYGARHVQHAQPSTRGDRRKLPAGLTHCGKKIEAPGWHPTPRVINVISRHECTALRSLVRWGFVS